MHGGFSDCSWGAGRQPRVHFVGSPCWQASLDFPAPERRTALLVPAVAIFLRASHVPLPTLCLGLPVRPQGADDMMMINKSYLKRTPLWWVNVSACLEEPEDALKRKQAFSVETFLLCPLKDRGDRYESRSSLEGDGHILRNGVLPTSNLPLSRQTGIQVISQDFKILELKMSQLYLSVDLEVLCARIKPWKRRYE